MTTTSKESTGLPPINPRREALAQAARALREKKKTLATRYKIYPIDQITLIEQEFAQITAWIEAEIIEIDSEERLASLRTSCPTCGSGLFSPDPVHICTPRKAGNS